jgi:hypothetical protein
MGCSCMCFAWMRCASVLSGNVEFTELITVSLAGKDRRSSKLSEGDDLHDIARFHLQEWGIRNAAQQGKTSIIADHSCSLFLQLLSVDENTRANFSVIRRAKFFTDM